MAKLTKAQNEFLDKIQRYKGDVYFRRENDQDDKEQCFIGSHRVNSRVFFFFFEIGYLSLSETYTGRKYTYYYMHTLLYKLNEYLEDFKQPYVVSE
jgi:hypothetical protein